MQKRSEFKNFLSTFAAKYMYLDNEQELFNAWLYLWVELGGM